MLSRSGAFSIDPDEVRARNVFSPSNHIYFTYLGKAFVRACRVPTRNSQPEAIR